jgi:hypothetical protein
MSGEFMKAIKIFLAASVIGMASVWGQDLDLGLKIFAAIGEGIFKSVSAAVSVEVSRHLGEALLNNPNYGKLNNHELNAALQQDFGLLLGSGGPAICYSTCSGWKSNFENFKSGTRLYGALLAELKDESRVKDFYSELNSRSPLKYMTDKYISSAGRLNDYGIEIATVFQRAKERGKPVTTAILISVNEILKAEESAVSASLQKIISLKR